MEPFIGMIVQFGGNFAPRGWALCDGQLLAINANQALFSILGTTYGGDGTQTFGLPDLRGRAAIHPGHGPGLSAYKLGQKGGAEQTTLTVNNLPSHNHSFSAISGDSKSGSPAGNALATVDPAGTSIYNSGTPNEHMADGVVGHTGGSQPFGNVQPYQCVNFIIATVGLYPSRD